MSGGAWNYFRINQIAKAGYKLDSALAWWFNEEIKVAVHDQVIRNDYSNFINGRTIGVSAYGWVFYSPTKPNPDIIDTVYKLHFKITEMKKDKDYE